ncbi:MAG TPA: galactokinase [Acidimicrobiales bacterium]|nr:galactokinase [Acidimicrobiales bacterium]
MGDGSAPARGVSGCRVRAHAPGRVNLIGDHTDYTGGLALPMAIDLGTDVVLERDEELGRVELTSVERDGRAVVDLAEPLTDRLADDVDETPRWARYVGGVIAMTAPTTGGVGTVSSSLPIGAGLASSAALEVAVALAVGFQGTAVELARACQQAEQLAAGVPCGVMDQLTSVCGRQGHALLLDCASLAVTPVALPEDVEVVALHSGRARGLAGSAYATRRGECEAAAAVIGPLRAATPADAESIRDPVLRRRARHVVTENARVREVARAMVAGDLGSAGAAMTASHRSLADDFEVSTPALDALVDELMSTPGVYGARMTGAGFGGCVVALAEPGAVVPAGRRGWVLRASAGASVETLG